MPKKLIVANWKNHPKTLAQAEEILERVNDFLESLGETKEFSLVFCPPAEFLESVGKILETSHFEHQAVLGAQDITEDLKKKNARYVIIGHSDRRWKLGESDKVVNQKLKAALADEIIPIVCIGERTRDPSTGSGQDFKDFLKDQTLKTFDGISADDVAKCIIAYEPVWAISTEPDAKPDTPESALESIKIIQNVLIGDKRPRREAVGEPTEASALATPTRSGRGADRSVGFENLPKSLYGGSVTSQNIADFLKYDEISGALIGAASVDKEEFVKILSQVLALAKD